MSRFPWVVKGPWNESKHRRDHGKFTSGGASAGGGSSAQPKPQSDTTGMSSMGGKMGAAIGENLRSAIRDSIRNTGDVPKVERGHDGKTPTFTAQAWDRVKQAGLHTHPEAPERFVRAISAAYEHAAANPGKMGDSILHGLNAHFGDLIGKPKAPAPAPDPRHNPDLDAAFGEPAKPAATAKPATNIRANPDLDAAMGMGAAKPAATSKPAKPPAKHTIQSAAAALAAQGHTLHGMHHDLKSGTTSYDVTRADGTKARLTAQQVQTLAGGKAKPKRAAKAKPAGKPAAADTSDIFASHATGTQPVNQYPGRTPSLPASPAAGHRRTATPAKIHGMPGTPGPVRTPAKIHGMPGSPSTGATPPALPHHRTRDAAVTAARALHAASKSGGITDQHRQAFHVALEEHRKAGEAHIDRMTAQKHGSGMRASRAARKAKVAFNAKLNAARTKLGTGGATPPPLSNQPPPLPRRSAKPAGGASKPAVPPPLPTRGGAGIPAKPRTSKQQLGDHVRHLAEHVAGNFNRRGANHEDVGHEIHTRLRKYPAHVAAAFKQKYGIRDGDSPQAAGRRFVSQHGSGWSKDPGLRPKKKAIRFPWVVKSRDASGHEHASDGRFGTVAGQHGQKKTDEPKAARTPAVAYHEDIKSMLTELGNDELADKSEELTAEFQEKIAGRIESWSEWAVDLLASRFSQAILDHPSTQDGRKDFHSEQDDIVDYLTEASDAVHEAIVAYADAVENEEESGEDPDEAYEAVESALKDFDSRRAEVPKLLDKVNSDYVAHLNEKTNELAGPAEEAADELNSTDYEDDLEGAKEYAEELNGQFEKDGNPFRLSYDEESDEWDWHIPAGVEKALRNFRLATKTVRFPWVVKSRDSSGHEHAADGRFGSGSGRAAKSKGKRARTSADPDTHARTLAAKIADVPHEIRRKVSTFVRSKYAKLSARYGDTGAKAIIGAAVLLAPVPVPGSSFVPIAFAEVVLRLRRAIGKSMSLDQAAIEREAKQLYAELLEHMGESHEQASGRSTTKAATEPTTKAATTVIVKRATWDESKHKRGQAENAGEFASTGGSGKKKPEKSGNTGGDQSTSTVQGEKYEEQARKIVKGKLKPTKERAWTGEPSGEPISSSLAGAIGEEVLIQYLKSIGYADAGKTSEHVATATNMNNLPFDLIHDHQLIEAKGGQTGKPSGVWALKYDGRFTKEQEAKFARMKSPEKVAAAKKKINLAKVKGIHDRKTAFVERLSKELGFTVKPGMMTVIVNPDTKTADIYRFDGLHDRIAWNSEQAKNGYVTSVRYG